ncbi:isoamyl acetate-hydrolyzing esterase [Trichomonascus vanleenenianus]|uniref:SGNH/GDSL hydrolase family protein n=1 Tax=Trichomonascus vanleenenianus TaxID=2268995 RepID=UPI003ECB77CD
MKLKKFILFGDSITRRSSSQQFGFNFAPALQDDYSCKLDIITRGFGGYNTEMAKHLIQGILEEEGASEGKIQLMTVFFGTNDASSGKSGISIDQYKQNLCEIIRRVKSYDIKVILVGPAIHEDVERTGERSSDTNLAYSNAALQVAQTEQIPFVDLWTAFAKSAGWTPGSPCPGENLQDLLIDGTHFNKKGYEILYSQVKLAIAMHYPDLDASSLPWLFPRHEDILGADDIKTALEMWEPKSP